MNSTALPSSSKHQESVPQQLDQVADNYPLIQSINGWRQHQIEIIRWTSPIGSISASIRIFVGSSTRFIQRKINIPCIHTAKFTNAIAKEHLELNRKTTSHHIFEGLIAAPFEYHAENTTIGVEVNEEETPEPENFARFDEMQDDWDIFKKSWNEMCIV